MFKRDNMTEKIFLVKHIQYQYCGEMWTHHEEKVELTQEEIELIKEHLQDEVNIYDDTEEEKLLKKLESLK
jgi:hypothetical protein